MIEPSWRGGNIELTPEEELGLLAAALVEEQKVQLERMRSVLLEAPINTRRKEGLTWSPVELTGIRFVGRGRQVLSLVALPGGGEPDAFRAGARVELSRQGEEALASPLHGIVRRCRGLELELVLERDELEAKDQHERWTIDAAFDERTFRVMAEALSHWINVERQDRKLLRGVVLGHLAVPESEASSPLLAPLNAMQSAAVHLASANPLLTVIQGPPGTGKTTTLVRLIAEQVRSGVQVLAAAPSNAATDVLASKCIAAGLKTIRIGNPIRVDDDVIQNTLEAWVERDREFKQVRIWRRQAEEAWREATRYRRTFDAQVREEKRTARQDAKALHAMANELERALEERILRQADVVCATLTGTADADLAGVHFPLLVVDEAGQALEPLVWAALRKADRVVLAGDPQQLPPTVVSSSDTAKRLEISLLEKRMARLDISHAPNVMLTMQYRMNLGIMEPVNSLFYQNRLEADFSVANRGLAETPSWLFLDTAGCGFEEDKESDGESTSNPEEAAFVAQRCGELSALHPSATMGVIAPYRAQVQLLQSALSALGVVADVATVDSFQGQERDIIVLSLTRSNEQGSIGFLSEYRRTNVAMSRAKQHLLVIGDSSTIGSDAFFSALLACAENNEAYRSAWEYL